MEVDTMPKHTAFKPEGLESVEYISRSKFDENQNYHKEINIEFGVNSDTNKYLLCASNVIYKNGVRNYYYEIMIIDEDLGPVLFDEESYANQMTPIVNAILHHPNVKLFTDWLNINKDPHHVMSKKNVLKKYKGQ